MPEMLTPEQAIARALEDDWLDLTPPTCREISKFIMRRLDLAGYRVIAKDAL